MDLDQIISELSEQWSQQDQPTVGRVDGRSLMYYRDQSDCQVYRSGNQKIL